MEIVCIHQKDRWNEIVKEFKQWDIYYLNEYVHSLQLHGDGVPYLIYCEKDGSKLCYAVMQNDIAEFVPLSQYVPRGKYYDWTTPYGYGGPLTEGIISRQWIEEFMRELTEWCGKHGIISQFFRFHPLLQNQKVIESVSDVIYMKKTVYIDTLSEDIIFKNMTPNNRNMVRKAKKNGVNIVIDRGERLETFIKIYEATMKNNGAESYYYFEKEYFEDLINSLHDNLLFFYAEYEGVPISASIFLYNENFMHYHLSGTLPEYRKLGATNLLLSEAAYWAANNGIKKFHLGGGLGIEDSLFSFKKHFNRNGEIDFCIGRNIFDNEMFENLVRIREQNDNDFDSSKPFLIKYRG